MKPLSGKVAIVTGASNPSLLAAALLDGIFEHPAALLPSAPIIIWKIPIVYCE
jgi:hypothetical protein